MNSIEWTFQLRFVVALALGFLIGLERESTKEHQKLVFGGVRTHPIISLFGFGCAWLYQIGAHFMLPAGLLSIGALTTVAYLAKTRGERFGSTSEISALLTFVVGALALLVDVWVAMAIGVVNALLLSEKARLETYVENLSRVEFLATIKFLLVTLIVLPVLPDQEYTQFHLNPSTIWKIVIIVSTIGFVGYVLTRRLGSRVGLWLSGILGGVVSSTALTVAVGRMAQREPGRGHEALQAALFAGAVMYIRIFVIVALINPLYVPQLWWKFACLALVGVVLALSVRRDVSGEQSSELPGMENPFEITPSLVFAGLFVGLSIVTMLVKASAGNSGVMTLAAVVGIVDIDPFILSLIQDSGVMQQMIASAILISMMSNTLVKGVYFGILVPSARSRTAWRYIVWAVLHLPLIFIS